MKLFGIAWELAIILGLLAAFAVAAPLIWLWLAYRHGKAKRAALKLVKGCALCNMPHGTVRTYRDEDPDYEPEPEDFRNEVPGA